MAKRKRSRFIDLLVVIEVVIDLVAIMALGLVSIGQSS